MPNDLYMMRAVKVSLVANVILCCIKLVALIIVGSIAIAADLGISCVALAVSIVLFYAVKISNKPADFLYNYGYGRIENVCEVMEGIVLIGLALAMSFQAIMHIVRVTEVQAPMVGLASCLIGVGINFGGAYYILQQARKSGSPALYAESIHFRLEGFISAAIAVAFILIMLATAAGLVKVVNYIDPVTTLFVSAVIAVPSARLLKEAFTKLLDASIEESRQIEVVKVLARHVDKYCNFKDLRTRSAGRIQFVEMDLIMPEHMSLREGHRVISEIKEDIESHLGECDVTIRIYPCDKNCFYARENENCPYSSE